MSSLTEKHRVWLEEAISTQSSQSFTEQSVQKEAREILDWALDRLSAAERMVLELVYLEGYSLRETAALLGWSIANVKVRSYSLRETAALLGWSIANVKVRSFRSRKKLHKLLTQAKLSPDIL
jgi:DNA-directed RNA polymerase specialized sigma24 family protein